MAKNIWDKIAEEDAATVLKAAELRGKAKEYSTENNKESPENAKEAKNIIDSADMIAKAKKSVEDNIEKDKLVDEASNELNDMKADSIKASMMKMMEDAKKKSDEHSDMKMESSQEPSDVHPDESWIEQLKRVVQKRIGSSK